MLSGHLTAGWEYRPIQLCEVSASTSRQSARNLTYRMDKVEIVGVEEA